MTYPLTTAHQYKQALIKVRDKHHISGDHNYLKLLRMQGNADSETTTATRMAEHVGFENFNAANLHYGKYAHLVAEALGYTPEKRKDGTYMWWMTFSSGNAANEDSMDGHFEFVMHPELRNALLEMRWIKK